MILFFNVYSFIYYLYFPLEKKRRKKKMKKKTFYIRQIFKQTKQSIYHVLIASKKNNIKTTRLFRYFSMKN